MRSPYSRGVRRVHPTVLLAVTTCSVCFDKTQEAGGVNRCTACGYFVRWATRWPLWAKALKRFAKPKDKGLGDVIARTIGDERSEAFKKWYKATFGKSCGCSGRQALLNQTYPLTPNVKS